MIGITDTRLRSEKSLLTDLSLRDYNIQHMPKSSKRYGLPYILKKVRKR